MRAAYGPAPLLIEGDFVGFNLSAGYCAEHERGINELAESLRVDPATFQTDCEDFSKVHFAESGGGSERVAILSFLEYKRLYKERGSLPMHGEPPKKFRSFSRELYMTGNVSAAWSSSEFAIMVKGRELISELKNLYAALLINDFCIWVGSHENPFARPSLCLAISSRLTEKIKSAWRKAHDKKTKKVIDWKINLTPETCPDQYFSDEANL